MKAGLAGAAIAAAVILNGCGRGDTPAGQPSAEERRALDNIAAKQDAESAETFDTSPDSLVPADSAGAEVNEAGNAAAPAPANASIANSAAPNGSAPR